MTSKQSCVVSSLQRHFDIDGCELSVGFRWSPQLRERSKVRFEDFRNPTSLGEGGGITGCLLDGPQAARECATELGDAVDRQTCAFGIRGSPNGFF